MIMFAFGVVAMIGCVAMVVDLGMFMTTRRNYQKIADTCASVGAQSATPAGRAASCITTNNIPDGATVNVPPSKGVYQGNNEYVEVLIDRNVPTVFMRVLGIQNIPIGVRAVAWSKRNLDFGVMGLQPGVDAVRSAGGSNSQINGNACSAGDFKVSGTLNVNGYTVANGSFSGTPNSLGSESGARSAPCEDPGYPLPTLPTPQSLPSPGSVVDVTCVSPITNVPASTARIRISCPANVTVRVSGPRLSVDIKGSNNARVDFLPAGSPSNATFQDVSIQGSGPVLLAPGWYDTISSTSGPDITLQSGLYMINSSYDQSGSGALTGSNVSVVAGHQFEATGSGPVNLSCCATEMQHNVLLYHTGANLPGMPSGWGSGNPPNAMDLMGNSSARSFTGNIYSPLSAPCDSPCIQIGGNATSFTISGQVAAPTIEINGTGNTVTFSGNGDSLFRRPSLVE